MCCDTVCLIIKVRLGLELARDQMWGKYIPVASTVKFSYLQEVDSSIVTLLKLDGSVMFHTVPHSLHKSWNDSVTEFTVSQLVTLLKLENIVIQCTASPTCHFTRRCGLVHLLHHSSWTTVLFGVLSSTAYHLSWTAGSCAALSPNLLHYSSWTAVLSGVPSPNLSCHYSWMTVSCYALSPNLLHHLSWATVLLWRFVAGGCRRHASCPPVGHV